MEIYPEGNYCSRYITKSTIIMPGDETNNDRIRQLEQSLKQFQESVQQTLQQITKSLGTLTTRMNEEPLNRRGPPPNVNEEPLIRRGPPPNVNEEPLVRRGQPHNRGRGYDRPHRQLIRQPPNNGEHSDVEEGSDDDFKERRRLGRYRNATEFDYRQRAKDVPSFHGSMNVEDFLDWTSELDNFFKFYEIHGSTGNSRSI